MAERHLIAVDWGTTSLRAYLVDAAGSIRASFKSAEGIQNRQTDFEATLSAAIGELGGAPGTPVLMAGMIGSRQGWTEAPYIETPCAGPDLAKRLTEVSTSLPHPVRIVPGLCDFSRSAPDVIRGEESKLLGLLAGEGQSFETVCMPGTHPKWASARGGRILSFRTYMTGEVFAVLCAHSILGRMMEAAAKAPDWAAFDAGLARAGEADHLLHHLFSVRTLCLFDRLPPKGVRDYLSGLLIGHETRAAAGAARSPVALIGDRGLTQRYARALSKLGLATEDIDEHVVVKGLVAIARAAQLLE